MVIPKLDVDKEAWEEEGETGTEDQTEMSDSKMAFLIDALQSVSEGPLTCPQNFGSLTQHCS